MVKIFLIQAKWQMTGTFEIEADSLEEAKEKVFDKYLHQADDAQYVEDTFVIDEDTTNDLNPDGEPYQTLK